LIAVGLFSDGSYGAGWNAVGATSYMGQPGRGVTGLFYGDPSQLVAQCVEAGTCIAWNVVVGGAVFWLIGKAIGGNRVSAETELGGLDVPEMGVPGYPDFVLQDENNHPVS
jgi:Amt family ammonium transporter